MGKAKDLTGQRFGRLVVIEKTEQRSQGNVIWKCKCDCGNTAYVKGINLRNGSTTSCGCMACIGRKKDLSNQRFGMLVALHPTQKRDTGGNVYWECRCDCGNMQLVTSVNLTKGRRKSCGCQLVKRKHTKGLTGMRFGKLTIVKPTDERKAGSVVFECKCDCGNTAFVLAGDLFNGSTKSCGCSRRLNRNDF